MQRESIILEHENFFPITRTYQRLDRTKELSIRCWKIDARRKQLCQELLNGLVGGMEGTDPKKYEQI